MGVRQDKDHGLSLTAGNSSNANNGKEISEEEKAARVAAMRSRNRRRRAVPDANEMPIDEVRELIPRRGR